jgi:hypothetical protein
MTTPVQRWVRTVTPDGQTHEDELRDVFLRLEEVLEKKGLLRKDYKTYRTLHFAEFCKAVHTISSVLPYGRPTYEKDSE